MRWNWFARAGAVCLVVGSVAHATQAIVTPISGADDAAKQVAHASAHLSAMGWALVLDVPVLLLIPGVLFVGWLAGAAERRLAAAATAIAFLAWLAATFLVATDVLVYEAARLGTEAATTMVHAYETNGFVIAMLTVFLIGQPVGMVLLASSLWRRRAVPVWAAVAIAVFPFLEFVGTVSDLSAVTLTGEALLVVGLAACARALLHGGARTAATASILERGTAGTAAG